ncbi:hypothetical protein AALA00_05670 [Lachnospiraceae bacterium 46-15]
MLEAIKKQFQVQWKDWMWYALIAAGVWLIGCIMFGIILANEGEDTYFELGTIMGCAVVVMMGMFTVMLQIRLSFDIEVSMGCTRLRFFMSFYIVNIVMNVLMVLLLMLLCAAERGIYSMAFPGRKEEVDIMGWIVRLAVPLALAGPMIGGLGGVLVMRFGQKAFWAEWAVWMLLCVGGPRIIDAAKDAPQSLFGMIGNGVQRILNMLPVDGWIIAGTAVCLACCAGSWLVLRKQQVTM